MTRIRIFVSFDPEHDTDLVELLQAQSRRPGSSFESTMRGPDGAMTVEWSERVRSLIRKADEVVVICGEHTDESVRVAAELRIVQEEEKPYMLLWGRRERMCTKPDGSRPGDAMYSWSRDILESQMAQTLRQSKPREVPEVCRRP